VLRFYSFSQFEGLKVSLFHVASRRKKKILSFKCNIDPFVARKGVVILLQPGHVSYRKLLLITINEGMIL